MDYGMMLRISVLAVWLLSAFLPSIGHGCVASPDELQLMRNAESVVHAEIAGTNPVLFRDVPAATILTLNVVQTYRGVDRSVWRVFWRGGPPENAENAIGQEVIVALYQPPSSEYAELRDMTWKGEMNGTLLVGNCWPWDNSLGLRETFISPYSDDARDGRTRALREIQ